MINMKSITELKSFATQLRRDILRMTHAVQSGHPGGSLGCADFFSALYNNILIHDPRDFTADGEDEDVFILSNGHISPVFYSTLARTGYFDLPELNTFRRLNSRLQGHPATHEGLPGVRIATGSLGQGFSVAVGIAATKKLNNDTNLVYVLIGDGESQEGQIWEAATYCAGKKVDNIIAVTDYNKKQIDGPTDDVMPLGDLKAKWLAFGWIVLEMDGNIMEELLDTLTEAKSLAKAQKPVMILMKTEMGMGVDFMMGTHKWHGVAPNDEQLANALKQLEETLGDF
jgi:transketolase